MAARSPQRVEKSRLGVLRDAPISVTSSKSESCIGVSLKSGRQSFVASEGDVYCRCVVPWTLRGCAKGEVGGGGVAHHTGRVCA